MENKKGVLFDMDGTLINTYENINLKQVLSELKTVPKTLILKILASRVKSFAQLETKIYEEIEDQKEAQCLIDRISKFLVEHFDNTTMKKDALAFLDYLKSNDYKICLCTNNATSLVEHIIQHKQLEGYFDYVITSQQVTRAKPDPQMYLEAVSHIGLSCEDCVVFEDAENGVMAAKNAGIDVIAICDKEKKKFSDCSMIIKDFSDERLYEIF